MILLKIQEVCPYCNDSLYVNKKVYANHIRWCNKNPRYNEILLSTKLKLSKTTKQDYIVNCAICNNEYTVNCTPHTFEIGKYKKTCSPVCAKKLTASKTDNESRINSIKTTAIKNALKHYESKNCLVNSLTCNYIKQCLYCGILFETNKIHKKYCCAKCANLHRKYLCKSDVKNIYHSACLFKFSLSEYPDEFDFTLIETFGWYSASNRGNNLNGVSRDHMFSCDEGWKYKIDPYLISHPANCMLMQQSLNASKRNKCSITVELLKERVNEWNVKYGVYPNNIDYSYFDSYNIIFRNK